MSWANLPVQLILVERNIRLFAEEAQHQHEQAKPRQLVLQPGMGRDPEIGGLVEHPFSIAPKAEDLVTLTGSYLDYL